MPDKSSVATPSSSNSPGPQAHNDAATNAESSGEDDASALTTAMVEDSSASAAKNVQLIEPGAGHSDVLYLQNIDRALLVGDLLIFFLSGIAVSVAMVGGFEKFTTFASGIALATVVFSRVLKSNHVYSSGAHKVDVRVARRLLVSISIMFAIITAVAIGFSLEDTYTRAFILWWLFAAAASIFLFRFAVAAAVREAIRRGRLRRRVAIYGGDEQGVAVIEHLGASDDAHYALVGFYDDRFQRVPSEINGQQRRGGVDELEEAVNKGYVDEVIVALPLNAVDRVSTIIGRLSKYSVTILVAPDLAMWRFFDRPFQFVGGAPMLRALEAPMEGWRGVAKFVQDRLLASILVVLCAPLFALIAIAIRLDSPGPVFFRQARRGLNNSVFSIFKFRTMYFNAPDAAGVGQATRNDARITRVGRFLRRTSLDELPQLLNVLQGDMSLVGPRPHPPGTKAEGILFEQAVANYMERYRVKPGITGWAQVNGWRGETETTRKLLVRVRYDIDYIEKWSVWFDLYILGITPLALIFRSQNAY